MAVVTFVAAATGGLNPTTSTTVTIPTVQVGDLLLLACTNRDATTAPSVTDNDTGGETWTKKTVATSKGTLWWKRATASTSAKTITASGFTGSCSTELMVLRGAYLYGDPFDKYTLEDNLSTDETHAAIVPSRNGCYVGLAVHNVGNDNSVTSSSTTSPGALTQGGEHLSTGGTDCATSLRGLVQATAGTTGNFTWAQTDGVTVSQAFAILSPAETTDSGVSYAQSNGYAVVRRVVYDTKAGPVFRPAVVAAAITLAAFVSDQPPAKAIGIRVDGSIVGPALLPTKTPSAFAYHASDQGPSNYKLKPYQPASFVLSIPVDDYGWQVSDQTRLPFRNKAQGAELLAPVGQATSPTGPFDSMAAAFAGGFGIESRVIYDETAAPVQRPSQVVVTPSAFGFGISDQPGANYRLKPYQPASFVFSIPVDDFGWNWVSDNQRTLRRQIRNEGLAAPIGQATGGVTPPTGPSDTMAAFFSEGFGIGSKVVYDDVSAPVRRTAGVITPSILGWQVFDQLIRKPPKRLSEPFSWQVLKPAAVITPSVLGWQVFDRQARPPVKKLSEPFAKSAGRPAVAALTPSALGWQVFDRQVRPAVKKLSEPLGRVVQQPAVAALTPSPLGWQLLDYPGRKIRVLDLRHWNDIVWTPGQIAGGTVTPSQERVTGAWLSQAQVDALHRKQARERQREERRFQEKLRTERALQRTIERAYAKAVGRPVEDDEKPFVEILKPYVKAQEAKGPELPPLVIDWRALTENLALIRQLLFEIERLELLRQQQADEDDMIMVLLLSL